MLAKCASGDAYANSAASRSSRPTRPSCTRRAVHHTSAAELMKMPMLTRRIVRMVVPPMAAAAAPTQAGSGVDTK